MSDRDRPPQWPDDPPDPQAAALAQAVAALDEADGPADEAGTWPERLWATVVAAGAHRWALPGAGADRAVLVRRYARLAEGSLTAAFILTQHDAAVRRLAPAAGREPV